MSFLKKIFGKKEEPITSYEDFWNWFQKHEKTFFKVVKEHGDIEQDFFDKLSPKLNSIKEGILLVTGMFDDNTVELIMTPDGIIKNIVFVEELVQSAPKIGGWQFTALKPVSDIKDVNIRMAEYDFNAQNISFYCNDYADFPDEIDITIVHDDFNEEDKTTITNGTFIFIDNYLGELNFITTIDEIRVTGKENNGKDLIPIEKLKDFLVWRQKEFIEKYDGIRYNTENDDYSMLEATLQNGNPLLAIINTDLLSWQSKASHPWIMIVEIKYDGENIKGMPNEHDYKLLNDIENEILEELKDYEGYLNIGRQTADGCREIYFACRDFRKPSKVLYQIQNNYLEKIDLSFEIYKDKYWQTFNRFIPKY
ncbi:hypothetical protein GCM10011514_28270 [Emticicia aquatilis]|uniref:DUF695 domain-containing protein n=1 Tax=Emticicia aquatilis TaxID=1537369 RepID=A0A916YV26_9BACT|nr:DUF695 domain-containing protein [Emticicia aquatilis]GGD62514.1 hypothetical protein GCM10011514_28270 [Emticicia aquatilis]